MKDLILNIAVVLNVGAMILNLYSAWRLRQHIKEFEAMKGGRYW